MTKENRNPLAYAPIPGLMLKFAVPSIVAMLVGALYNIVDQLFIGQAIGPLGNAATNIAFPLSTLCISLALMFGIGGASCFNLELGRGEKEKAPYYAGNSYSMLAISGIALAVITLIFLDPMLKFFGSPENVMPYAREYVSITAIGFPFLIITGGGGHLIRADGSPQMTMICNITGAVINTILDAVFVMVFGWGMAGAAIATVIGQICSSALVFSYLFRYKTVKLEKKYFIIKKEYTLKVASIGMAAFINQIAMMIVIIVMNNSLNHYGSLSEYGAETALACVGIVMKVNQIMFSIVIGIGQGSQPIESFNYGAKNYKRVRDAFLMAVASGIGLSLIAFAFFQAVPEKILSLFGNADEKYFEFGAKFFRIFLFFTFLNPLQPIVSTFFTSIGKPVRGIILSLSRQIVFFLPVLVILPAFMGMDGILFTGPLCDFLSAMVAIFMAAAELKNMNRLEKQNG